LSKLGIGTTGYILTMNAGLPSWQPAPASGVTTFQTSLSGLTPSTATSGAVTLAGTLGVASGGTGLASLTANYIPYGNGTGALQSSANLQFNGTAMTLSGQLNLTNASNYNLYASGAGTNFMQSALGIGAPTSNDVPLLVAVQGTGANINGVRVYPSIPSTATGSFKSFQSIGTTAAAAFTLPNLTHYEAFQSTIGAGSTVTNQYGFYALSNLTGATNNYGFRSDIASGTGLYNFYAAGTAANVFVGTTSIGGTVGSESLRVTPVASAVNYINAYGGAAANSVVLNAEGSDTNINFQLSSKGSGNTYFNTPTTGRWSFYSGNYANEQFRVATTASAVNYIQAQGNSVGTSPYFLSQGSDTNVGMLLSTKGTGNVGFYSNAFASLQFNVVHTASAVNYLQVTGAATGNYSTLSAQGSDTNSGIYYQTKGSGYHGFVNSAGNIQFLVAVTTSAFNYLQVTGAAIGVAPVLSAQGYDANINTTIASKGSGGVWLNPANQGTPALVAAYVASPVNYALVYPSTTGNAVQFGAQGSDTNINLYLSPKGSGLVQFGTYTAGTVVQAGYITIVDAAGNTRRLLVG
jgi:hypothetical protein